MPRHRGIGMPKAKKKPVVQPEEEDEGIGSLAGAPSPAKVANLTHNTARIGTIPWSPGLKAVKEAAYDARKKLGRYLQTLEHIICVVPANAVLMKRLRKLNR